MRLWKNRELVGNKIIRLGPLCIKRYGVHKQLPNIPAVARLRREIVGASLLSSQHVVVTRPWVWSKWGVLSIRPWYLGKHPDKHHRPTMSEIHAFANWLSEHRGLGGSVPFRTDANLAIRVRFSMLEIQNQNDLLAVAVLGGNDLLHADLIPENILLGNKKPIVLDPESVSVGHLAWDAAMVLTNILRDNEGDQIASEFLDRVGLKGADRELVWNLVNLFKNQ